MLKDPRDQKTLTQVRRLLAAAPAELDQIGADPHAVLALAPALGVSMSAARDGAVVRPGKGGTHGFFPDNAQIQTGFVGYGPGFAAGKVVPQMALQDIAPIAAQLLGLPFNPGKSPLPAQVVQ